MLGSSWAFEAGKGPRKVITSGLEGAGVAINHPSARTLAETPPRFSIEIPELGRRISILLFSLPSALLFWFSFGLPAFHHLLRRHSG